MRLFSSCSVFHMYLSLVFFSPFPRLPSFRITPCTPTLLISLSSPSPSLFDCCHLSKCRTHFMPSKFPFCVFFSPLLPLTLLLLIHRHCFTSRFPPHLFSVCTSYTKHVKKINRALFFMHFHSLSSSLPFFSIFLHTGYSACLKKRDTEREIYRKDILHRPAVCDSLVLLLTLFLSWFPLFHPSTPPPLHLALVRFLLLLFMSSLHLPCQLHNPQSVCRSIPLSSSPPALRFPVASHQRKPCKHLKCHTSGFSRVSISLAAAKRGTF